MNKMINFAIDLGTTNSLIAKFEHGEVEIFKSPDGQSETLRSVVGFRNDRILFGKQALTYLGKDPQNVKGRFKRMMGTTESFRIKSLGQSKTPVELSALVLKELKTYIHTGEVPESVVITVPASFDMVQSNATTEAGYAAGFKQVVLFQEPIAASLAYANKEKGVDLKNSQWIVYDLGGGTFDVALVKIVAGELKVVDHEGDNYLGGMDFDALMVERLIAPQLEKRGQFSDLVKQMKSETSRFNKLWYSLLHLAEQAKIELSTKTSTEIDLGGGINVEDENRTVIDGYIEITRSEFEALIKEAVDKTAAMLKKILTRNSLRPDDLKFVLMVGGSTFIPFVRKRVEELLGIPVNTGINPTNAVVAGAAYFAATKEVYLDEGAAHVTSRPGDLKVRVAYNRASQEHEEMFSARVDGEVAGLFYRIRREDGGYDSGLKELTTRIVEDLPLQADAYNLFSFTIYNVSNNPVPTDLDPIQIAQGKYSVAGQIVPHDLSLVRDDIDANDTKLDCIFAKNTVIPSRAKRTCQVNRTVSRGSANEAIHVIVVEGPSENHPYVNRKQGILRIAGDQLKQDARRGTDIDLTFELSESRELTVTANINSQDFSQVFGPQYRELQAGVLADELKQLATRIDEEQDEAVANERFEIAQEIGKLRSEIHKLQDATANIPPYSVTDEKLKIDNDKRDMAQKLDRLTAGKRLQRLRADYKAAKKDVTDIVNESGNDLERRQLREVVTREHTFMDSAKAKKLEDAISELRHLEFQILQRKPEFLIGLFQYLLDRREAFNDQLQAKTLIEAGKRHVAAEDFDRLFEVIGRLFHLLPVEDTDESGPGRFFRGTGIS